MKLRTILGASICLNLILSAVHFSPNRPASPSLPTAHLASDPKAGSLPAERSASSSDRPPRPWQNLQSDDLRIYTANLRAAGFPEPLVHKIIIAELDRQIAAERRRAPVDTNFWKTGFQRDEAQRKAEVDKKTAALQRDQRIHDLLGPPVHQASDFRGDELCALVALTGVTDLETLDRLSGVWPTLVAADAQKRNPAAHRELYNQALAEMRSILGAEGAEEFELRAITIDLLDIWGAEMLFGCRMTGPEFREFLRLRKEIMPPDRARGSNLKNPDAPAELTQKIDDQTRVLLGEERFNGYLRAKSGGFRGIHRLFRDEPTMELSWAVHDIYTGLKEASSQIQNESGLGQTERHAALRVLRADTERALATKMGPEKFATYFQKNPDNFRWLDELTVPASAQP